MASFLQRGRTVGEEAEDGAEDGTVVGPGPGDGPTTTAPPATAASTAPRSLALRGGDEVLEASWSAPAPSDIGGFDIVRYVVQWRSGADQFGTDPAREATISPPFADPVTHSLTALRNGTEYSVRVAAVTRAGQGDWSDTVSATPYGRPRSPDLKVWQLYKALTVEWTPHSDTGGLPVAGYRLQWKSGSQEFVSGQGRDISVTSGLAAAEFSHTVDGLTPGTEYTFRVWAYTTDSDTGGDRRGHAATASATPLSTPSINDHQALRRFMESIVEQYESASPWTRTAWDRMSGETIRLVTPASLSRSTSATDVRCDTHTNRLRTCNARRIEVRTDSKESAEVVMHALAHAYLQTTGLHSDEVRDALGAAWLFFHDKHYVSDKPYCPVELFVDALVSLTMDSPTLRYYPSVCTLDSALSSEAIAVMQSVFDGEVSEWFTDNYCTAATAWAKVKSASDVHDDADLVHLGPLRRMGRSMLVYNMQGLFGGYRSARIAAQAGYVADSTETNPWNHTVCTIPDPEPPAGSPGSPGSLTLAPGSGQITASWAAPADTGTSAITGYELQWRLADDAYDQTDASTRKTTLGASTLSHTVTGLDSERYAMRVRAVNGTGKGAWSGEMYSQPS